MNEYIFYSFWISICSFIEKYSEFQWNPTTLSYNYVAKVRFFLSFLLITRKHYIIFHSHFSSDNSSKFNTFINFEVYCIQLNKWSDALKENRLESISSIGFRDIAKLSKISFGFIFLVFVRLAVSIPCIRGVFKIIANFVFFQKLFIYSWISSLSPSQ